MSRAMLLQLRRSFKRMIDRNPQYILISRKGTTTNGFGETVINPIATPLEKSIKCMIAHVKDTGSENLNTSPAGFTQPFGRYISVNHNIQILEGDEFEARNGINYRIGKVDKLNKFNGIIGYQAILIEAE